MSLLPPRFPGGCPEREFRTPTASDTTPVVTRVDANAGLVSGGTPVTVYGRNFIVNAQGAGVSVLFGGVAAASVVVVNRQTITCVTPASSDAGLTDVTVTNAYGQSGTGYGVFTYYEPVISSVDPAWSPFAGGDFVTVYGFNFDPSINYEVWFGDTPATMTQVIDEQTIRVEVPSHTVGFCDVILKSPSSAFDPDTFGNGFDTAAITQTEYARLRNGFQFTLLTRGEDIRRTPGIVIQDTLNNAPNTCTFRIDGTSRAPVYGEKVEITDELDNNRRLFAGIVQSITQVYEGQIDQLAWDVECVDFTWYLNKIRPVGFYVNVSASDIVKDLLSKFAPGFSANHVQTNLAKVTIILTGNRDLATVLSDIAKAIGGGHWYADYDMDVHFFHTPPDESIIPPSLMPSFSSFMTASSGGAIPSAFTYDEGFYVFRHTFVYSDGTESTLQAISNVVFLDGTQQVTLSNIPIGTARGDLTVVARRIYYAIAKPTDKGDSNFETYFAYAQLSDNTTTTFTSWFGTLNPSVATVEAIDSSVHHVHPTSAPVLALGPVWPQTPIPTSHTDFSAIDFTMRYTFVYDDGVESTPSPSATLTSPSTTNGWTATIAVGGAGVVARRLYLKIARNAEVFIEIPDNTTTVLSNTSGGNNGVPYAYPTNIAFGLIDTPGATTGTGNPPSSVLPIPNKPYSGHASGPSTAPQAQILFATQTRDETYAEYLNGFQTGGNTKYSQYKVAFLYRDGSISFPGPASNSAGNPNIVWGSYAVGEYLTGIPVGPTVNGNDVVARIIYRCQGADLVHGTPLFTLSAGSSGSLFSVLPKVGRVFGPVFAEPNWSPENLSRGFVVIPDNTTTSWAWYRRVESGASYFPVPVTYTPDVTSIPQSDHYGFDPVSGRWRTLYAYPSLPWDNSNILSSDPIPVWPNPDGPSLEDDDPPDDITNDNDDLLHEDSGSQPFTVRTDMSQIRNRVKVIGSGTVVTEDANIGASQVFVADITTMSPSGGRVRVINLDGSTDYVNYDGVTGITGKTAIQLSGPLKFKIRQGAAINNFFQADHLVSQKLMGKAERDLNGRPTDGVHEYVIEDSSLKAAFQLYMRAFAELELFAMPVVTIKYATRDPRSRSGQMVHVDMDNPPCHGDFLIQSVTIDQIRDESDQLTPRYTVTASSVRFELNDLLLQIVTSAESNSGAGIAASGAWSAQSIVKSSVDGNVPTYASDIFPFLGQGFPGTEPRQTLRLSGSLYSPINSTSWFSYGTAEGTGIVASIGSPGNFDLATRHYIGYAPVSNRVNIKAQQVWTRAEYEPFIETIIRFPSGGATNPIGSGSCRFWFMLLDSTTDITNDVDSLASRKGCGIRFSEAAGDAYFRSVHCDGTTQTVGAYLSTMKPTLDTVFTLSIRILSGGSLYQVGANGIYSGSIALPAIVRGQNMGWHMYYAGGSGSNWVFQVARFYLEMN